MKQAYHQLGERYDVSSKTIRRYIDRFVSSKPSIPKLEHSVVLLDTTCFKEPKLMLFKDAITGVDIYWEYVDKETVNGYAHGINKIKK